jgi:hypothetical protein
VDSLSKVLEYPRGVEGETEALADADTEDDGEADADGLIDAEGLTTTPKLIKLSSPNIGIVPPTYKDQPFTKIDTFPAPEVYIFMPLDTGTLIGVLNILDRMDVAGKY